MRVFTSPNLHPGKGPTLPSAQWVPMLFPKGHSSQGVKLTIHIYLVLRWRMNGVLPPIPLYVFRVWTRTVPLPSHICTCYNMFCFLQYGDTKFIWQIDVLMRIITRINNIALLSDLQYLLRSDLTVVESWIEGTDYKCKFWEMRLP